MSSKIDTTNKIKTAFIYLTPLVVYAFSLCGERIFAADAQKGVDGKAVATAMGASSSNVQPVTSGVKLLEGIFQKLRNQPQLAFGNSRAQNLLQAAGLSSSAGKNASTMTDQLLAIRPAERGSGSKGLHMSAMESDSFASAASAPAPVSRAERRTNMIASMPKPQAKPLAQSISNFANAAATLQAAADGNIPRVQTYSGGYGGGRGQVIANAPMITEFRDFSSASNQYGSAASGNLKQMAPMKAKKSLDENARLAYAPANVPQLQAATNGTVGPQGADATFVTNAPAAEPVAPASPGLFKNIREFGNKQEMQSNNSASGIKEMFDARKDDAAMDKNQIAMLPPSIVSGLPLVHLGASALQIKESLGSRVKIDKQNIDDWNVWSVYGKGKSECALQLYFKHGVVEAIRVFDAGYLGVDLGVKLGSDLQSIKEKFGEPAFILPEPAAGHSIEAGKNYIYPISQVSFALARSRDRSKPAPTVVSMLIFNVK